MEAKILNYKTVFVFIIFLYFPYSNILSWGGDYAHYMLQGLNLNDLNDFISKQHYLNSLTSNNRFAIYTPFGLPVLFNITSFLHMWNIYYVKLITPISFLIVTYCAFKLINIKYLKYIYIIFLLNPHLLGSFKEIYSEFPAFAFFMIGLTFKNSSIAKSIFFFISFSIRPSYLIFIFIDLIFEWKNNNKIKDLIIFVFIFMTSNLLFYFSSGLSLLGQYDRLISKESNSFLPIDLNLSVQSLLIQLQDRGPFLLSEVGRLFLGFSNRFNLFVGLVFILLILTYRNKFSYMIFFFSAFHLVLNTPYYVRYLLPVIFLTILYLNDANFKFKIYKYNNLALLIPLIVYFTLSINQYSNLDSQRGPHQKEAVEVMNYVKYNYPNQLVAFHSPRVFRLFTDIDSYRYDSDFIDGSIWVCEKLKEICKLEKEEIIFENNLYIVLK